MMQSIEKNVFIMHGVYRPTTGILLFNTCYILYFQINCKLIPIF